MLLNLFPEAESIGLVAGLPAFIVAASPKLKEVPNHFWPFALFAGLVIAGVFLGAAAHWQWSIPVTTALAVAGVLIGFLIRTLDTFRRFWLPAGLLLAFAIGAIVFSFGHYGLDLCWP